MPAALLCAQSTDQELALRKQARIDARRTLPNPAATARAVALAICEIEAGLRSVSQLERICHPACGTQSPAGSSGPEGHRSVAPVPCGSGSRSSNQGSWMLWRWSAGVSERCSSRCG